MKPKQIIQLKNEKLEAHTFGEHVAVIFPLKSVTKSILGADGLTYSVEVLERSGDPYINFVHIRQGGNGSKKYYYNDEDTVGRGGMSGKTALEVSKELEAAVEYLFAELWESVD